MKFCLSNYRLGLEAKKEENLSDWFSQVREFCTITNHYLRKSTAKLLKLLLKGGMYLQGA